MSHNSREKVGRRPPHQQYAKMNQQEKKDRPELIFRFRHGLLLDYYRNPTLFVKYLSMTKI